MEREALLTRTFVELADSLVDEFDAVDVMALLAKRVVSLTGGQAAGLVLLDGFGSMRLVAATSEATETIELFQIQNEEGPCRDCCHTGTQVSVEDLAGASRRWPAFVPFAIGAGYRSVHAFPLTVRSTTIGALGVFGAEPLGLASADVELTQAMAHVATIAVLQSQAATDAVKLTDQLHHALESRVVIEQAKGMVAEQGDGGTAEAFDLLRSYSRNQGELLTNVCRKVVDGSMRHADLRAPRPAAAQPSKPT